MSKSELIRETARKLRADVLSKFSAEERDALQLPELMKATSSHLGIDIIAYPPDSPILRGSKAAQYDDTVVHDSTLSDGYREYCILHEIGHFVLHSDSQRIDCATEDFENQFSDDGSDYDAGFGYGPKMQKEREANLFALEYLLPTDFLSESFLNAGERPFFSIYENFKSLSGQSDSFLISQLSRAILLRPPSEAVNEPEAEKKVINPNESQRRAAEIEKGPLLLVAGPGTGKTKTLIERIIFLLKQGHDPSSILALTFSTKATEEIQERVEAFDKDAAMKISIYNFHGFALELLRKYWREAGLDQSPKIVTRLDAVLFLESQYESLQFNLLEDLIDPTQPLVECLNFISSLQDELISPNDFEKLIDEDEVFMKRNEEADGDLIESRERTIAIQREVLHVYRKYFEFLNETKSLDYGEMIFRCVRLLRENPNVLDDVRARYKHVLVDEFQDVNRASGVFLKLIAGDGDGLWAVGDIRQSIYRWRGASPENIERFHDEYPSASKLHLEENYRSAKKIVDLFSSFASKMQSGKDDAISWSTSSTREAEISYRIFPDDQSESISIAENIRENTSAGAKYSDHAVVARNKKSLLRISKELENQKIPVLYLGALFEREEVRDLLCLLDLRSSAEGNGLLRASKFKEFRIPEDDVKLVLAAVNRDDNDFQKFIESDEVPEGFSEKGLLGLKSLRDFLSRNPRELSAYEFLGRVLFKEGVVLRSRLENFDKIRTPQELLAIHQLVSLTRSVEQPFREFGEKQIEKFLHHLRLLIALKEHHQLSKIPDSLSKFDAVRIHTVHSSKGLEFEHVFIPSLNKGSFPSTEKGSQSRISLPLFLERKMENHHHDEEECLFFVAASRAKEKLILTRPGQNKKGKITESPFLEMIREHITPEEHESKATFDVGPVRSAAIEKTSMHFRWIEDYRKCPRQFFYKRVMEADGKHLVTPYQRYRRSISKTFDELKKRFKPQELESSLALAVLEEAFLETELDSQPNAKAYRKNATRIIESYCQYFSRFEGEFRTHSMTLQLENGQVYFYPDVMIVNDSTARIFKVELKDKPKEVENRHIGDAMFLMADVARKDLAFEAVQTSVVFLPSMDVHEFDATERLIKTRKANAEKDIGLIREGYFEAKPDEWTCKKCQYFFPCPS